jgi:hypothetical protein
MEAWTPESVADLTQIPYRTLMRWLKTGCVQASLAPPRGERKQVLLSLEDVLEVCVAATLRRTGHSMDYVVSLLRQLRADGASLVDVYLIVVDDELVSIYRSAREAAKLFGEPGQKILLPVAHWRELAQRVAYPKDQVIVA